MNPEQALQLLDSASATAAGTRKDHHAVMEAVSVLRALIDASKPKPEPIDPLPVAG